VRNGRQREVWSSVSVRLVAPRQSDPDFQEQSNGDAADSFLLTELRRFSFDPIERVMANRGAYVAAALTIARAYRESGE
jgi:hypothetical protein